MPDETPATPTTPVPRCDFVLLFDVTDGNPNGDPDAGNAPRIDPETGQGLVTDVCLKRKVRNFVQLTRAGEKAFDIYFSERAVLNEKHQRAYDALLEDKAIEETTKKKDAKDKERTYSKGAEDLARDWMCQHFYDVRTFGAVMSTGVNAGQVRGPVQVGFARSLDAVTPHEHSITRQSVTSEDDAKKQGEKQSGQRRTMGRKETVPYGLYRAVGVVNPFFAGQTGFGPDDLDLLWQALARLFDNDQSAARANMNVRGLYVFEHAQPLGNAPAHALHELIQVSSPADPPRTFADYTVTLPAAADLPSGITLRHLDGYELKEVS